MKKLVIYVDASVVGGLEDGEFFVGSNALWRDFELGRHLLGISAHTLRELAGAPASVRKHLEKMPESSLVYFRDSKEAQALAGAYVKHGVVGPGSSADALHVALATVGNADVIVSWNFKHIVNFGRIRLFNAVNMESGYGSIEIRTPPEVLDYEKEI